MTHIVPREIKTKKALKEAIASGRRVFFEDPSIFPGSCSGTAEEILKTRVSFVCTNHPERTWFAKVSLAKDGTIKIL